MIGRLTGTISPTHDGHIILDVHGVGYLVNIPTRDLVKLPTQPQKKSQPTTDNLQLTTLFIHTHVKEEYLDLYGFLDPKDLQLFKHLITVSGVGPKLALTILSKHTSEEVTNAITQADTTFFQSISGIGKKNAQKIIVELKSKFASLKELDLTGPDKDQLKDLVAAMKSLGYNTAEIKPMLKEIPSELTATEEQIKYLLKELR